MDSDKTILLVEDHPDIVAMYQSAFSITPFKLLIAQDRRGADKVMREQKVDLILLDIIIPEAMNSSLDYDSRQGFKFLEDVRREEKWRDLPVITLTNIESKKDRETAAKLGSLKYVVKSEVQPQKVVEITRQALA